MKAVNAIKRIVGTLILPVLMFLIMMWLCYSHGKMYFGTWSMWRTILANLGVSVTCAMGIGLQFKNGRFDFSGGAIMLLAAIIAGNFSKNQGNVVTFVLLCIVICVILSLVVALVYIYSRVPIIITTIGMALIYEAITCLIYNGSGINLIANTKLNIFSSYPWVLLPLIGAIVVYAIYSYKTTTGKRSQQLANNQQAAVNIGINENRAIIISYIYSGIIFGLATVIYCTTAIHKASFTSLGTVGELFVNILPVFIGLLLSGFCGDTIGIIVGSLTLCLMNFGLSAALSAELGSAISVALTGVFMLIINVIAAQGGKIGYIWQTIKNSFRKKPAGTV